MLKSKLVILFILIVGLNWSCRKQDIAIPSYIYIPEIKLNVTSGQGTELHGIDRVNVYINDNSVGIFQVPVTFPVTYTGATKVDVRPMMKQFARDGILIYSPWDVYSETLSLEAKQIDTLVPVFNYVDNAAFPYLEDFNDNTASFSIKSGTVDTIYVENNPDITFDGTPYMHIDMGKGETFFEIETQDIFQLPSDGRDVYLEMDYRCNAPFTIGVFVTEPSQVITLPSVTPNPTNGVWRKAYVYLTDETRNRSIDTRFRLFLRSVNGEDINPHIYLDNIKLVFREG